MKLTDMTCPNCGGNLILNKDSGSATCEMCGNTYFINEHSPKWRAEVSESEQKQHVRSSRNFALLIVIICVFLLVILIYAISSTLLKARKDKIDPVVYPSPLTYCVSQVDETSLLSDDWIQPE